MARDAISERDLRRRLSIPPTFDVANHLRGLRRVLIPALVGALVIAIAWYFVIAAKPAIFESSVVAKIDSGTVANLTDVTVNTLAPPFVALSQSRPVLEDVIKRSAVATTPEDLAKNLSVSVETSPSLVQVTARGSSPADAVALSSATVAALDFAIYNTWVDKVTNDVANLQNSAVDTMSEMGQFPEGSPQWDVLKADYDSQVDRARQTQSTPPTRIGLLSQSFVATQVAPLPVQQALVAFVGSLVVLLEGLAFLNGRIGRRSSAAWLHRQADRRGYAVEPAAVTDEAWPVTTQVLLNRVAVDEQAPIVLYPEASSNAAIFVKRALEGTDPESFERYVQTSTRTLESDWWRELDNARRGLAIVVVDTSVSNRPALVRAFHALDSYGLPVQIVMVRTKRNGLSSFAKSSPRKLGKSRHR